MQESNAITSVKKTEAKPKKITLATIKSFVKKNRANLLINCISHFDGMIDCVEYYADAEFVPVSESGLIWGESNTLGIQGAWFVGSSRDYFSLLNKEGYFGYHVYNCCGSFDLAIKV